MSDDPALQKPVPMVVDVPDAAAVAIEDLVDAQQDLVDHCVSYAVGSLDRLQSGDFDVGAWGRDLSRLISETSADAVRALAAFARIGVGR